MTAIKALALACIVTIGVGCITAATGVLAVAFFGTLATLAVRDTVRSRKRHHTID